MSRLIPILLVAGLALAGCITVPEDSNTATRTERVTNDGGAMTARETREDSVAPCASGLGLPGGTSFCATRVVTVTGTISGVSRMSVSLSTFNGGVSVGQSDEGDWGFVATLEARGATAEAAKANLDNVELAWSHEDGGSHHLDVQARQKVEARAGEGYAAKLAATMPPELVMALTATTSNGGIDVMGAITDGLVLTTSNGGIEARASVTDVVVKTSNGGIDAHLLPTSSGGMTLGTSNGRISLAVTESPRHGYSIDASTSNGEIDYDLRDGEAGPCPGGSEYYTPPCTKRSFETRNFASRAVKSQVSLSTSNGAIEVRSA